MDKETEKIFEKVVQKESLEKELFKKLTWDILDLHRKIKHGKKERRERFWKEKEYNALKKKLIESHPEQAESIKLLLGIRKLGELEKKIEERGKKTPKEVFLELVSWQQKIAKFLLEKDQETCKNFWESFKLIFRDFCEDPRWRAKFLANRNGLVGQIGVYKTLEHFNLKPEFSLPREDAFEQTDLYCVSGEERMPAQIKYTGRVSKPLIYVTDKIDFPSPVIERGGTKTYISAEDIKQMTRLKASCEKMSKMEGKEIRGLYLACPWSSFDEISGQPTKEFLKQIKPEIEKYFS